MTDDFFVDVDEPPEFRPPPQPRRGASRQRAPRNASPDVDLDETERLDLEPADNPPARTWRDVVDDCSPTNAKGFFVDDDTPDDALGLTAPADAGLTSPADRSAVAPRAARRAHNRPPRRDRRLTAHTTARRGLVLTVAAVGVAMAVVVVLASTTSNAPPTRTQLAAPIISSEGVPAKRAAPATSGRELTRRAARQDTARPRSRKRRVARRGASRSRTPRHPRRVRQLPPPRPAPPPVPTPVPTAPPATSPAYECGEFDICP